MTDHAFPEAWRRGLYETITRRRDMRAFLKDSIPDETLARILMAAHQAGSTARKPRLREDSSLKGQPHDGVR